MNQENNIELRNDEVRDILQKMPHWAIRWGISIIFGAMVLLLVFTWLYRYPTLIKSEVVVSAIHPPAALKARATGKITNLPVAEAAPVKAGELLAVIENPANSDHVLQLEAYLKQLEPFMNSFDPASFIQLAEVLELGDVQTYYADFNQKLNNYLNFIDQKLHAANIRSAGKQLNMQKIYYDRLWSQRKLMEAELQLARKSFQRDSQLYRSGVISDSDYDQISKELIGQQLQFEKIRTQLATTQSGIYEMEQHLATLKIQLDENEKQLQLEVVKAFNLLEHSIDNWKLTYQLVSPIDGRVSLDRVWSVNQNVETGTTVMTIVPDDTLQIIGKAYIPTKGAGKVKIGQRVNIKLNNYPYMEYGMLIGKIQSIAPIPVNNFYAVEIELPQNLTTNYGTKLEMQQELWGNCEIITEDLRLLQRVIYPVKAVIEKNRR